MKWAKKFFRPLFCPTIRCKNIVADDRLDWVYESDQQKSIGIKRNHTEISQKVVHLGDNLLPKIVVGAMNKPTLLFGKLLN